VAGSAGAFGASSGALGASAGAFGASSGALGASAGGDVGFGAAFGNLAGSLASGVSLVFLVGVFSFSAVGSEVSAGVFALFNSAEGFSTEVSVYLLISLIAASLASLSFLRASLKAFFSASLVALTASFDFLTASCSIF